MHKIENTKKHEVFFLLTNTHIDLFVYMIKKKFFKCFCFIFSFPWLTNKSKWEWLIFLGVMVFANKSINLKKKFKKACWITAHHEGLVKSYNHKAEKLLKKLDYSQENAQNIFLLNYLVWQNDSNTIWQNNKVIFLN